MSTTMTDKEFADKLAEADLDQLQQIAVAALGEAVDREEANFYTEEQRLAEYLQQIGRQTTEQRLAARADDEPTYVRIDGVLHKKVRRGAATPHCPYGRLRVERSLYRPVDDSEADTVGLLEAKCAIMEGWTPRMADIGARFEGSLTSRESHELLQRTGLKPPSRASLERKAGHLGNRMANQLQEAIAHSRQIQHLPEETVAVVVGLDRISVPFEEPKEDGDKSLKTQRLRQKVPYKRAEPDPVEVNWRMDYVGHVTLLDAHGQQLDSYRYTLPHHREPEELAGRLCEDVAWVLADHPELKVAACQDGARELWPVLSGALDEIEGLAEEQRFEVVDWCHFSPRLLKLSRAFGWGSGGLESRRRELLEESGTMATLHQWVCEHAYQVGTGSGQKAIERFLSYLSERLGEEANPMLFDYGRQRKAGLPIGSGMVEATAKTVVTMRMKLAGARWSREGAEATETLRAVACSDERWDHVFGYLIEDATADVVPLHEGTDPSPTPRKRAA